MKVALGGALNILARFRDEKTGGGGGGGGASCCEKLASATCRISIESCLALE